MDTTDRDISFDINGYCNHCSSALNAIKSWELINEEEKAKRLAIYVERLKKKNANKKYDCIIGISGGVDSSYLAYYVVKVLKLRPLAFHVDNGWNSELAIDNINNLVKKLNIDLITHVINWEEFKILQQAFLRSSVVDLEMLTENAFWVELSRYSKKHNVNDFILGMNLNTETIMPASWLYSSKFDGLNIKSIYKKFGKKHKFKTYHFLNSFYSFLIFKYRTIKNVFPLLDYINYNKNEALDFLKTEYGWRDYGGKHYESIITHFYQVYILPKKFGIDKRKAHFSSLIVSELMTREEALFQLKEKPISEVKMNEEKEYFLKKLEITNEEFEKIMARQRIEHSEYSSYENKIQGFAKFAKKMGLINQIKKIVKKNVK